MPLTWYNVVLNLMICIRYLFQLFLYIFCIKYVLFVFVVYCCTKQLPISTATYSLKDFISYVPALGSRVDYFEFASLLNYNMT